MKTPLAILLPFLGAPLVFPALACESAEMSFRGTTVPVQSVPCVRTETARKASPPAAPRPAPAKRPSAPPPPYLFM